MTTATHGTLVGDEARDLVERDYDAIAPDDLPLWERARALKVVGRECDSFARLGAGFLAWIGGGAAAASLAVAVASDVAVWVRLLGLVAAAALGTGSFLLGRRVWLAGRRVVDAFCWWMLLPERMPGGGAGVDEWRATPVRDAVLARVFVFEGWRFLRIGLSALTFLAPLTVLQSLQGGPRYESPAWVGEQTASVAVFVVAFAAVSFSTGAILMRGQWRMNWAHSERDPIQRWLLRRDR